MLEYTEYDKGVFSGFNTDRRVTVYRGQKTWDPEMVITANSLRRSGGSLHEREAWTMALLTQFRSNIAGAMRGEQESRERLEDMLLHAQQMPFPNPFVSCSFSTATARYYANAGDILTSEGPWYSGMDFEFVRKLFGFYGGPFSSLQEYGLPERLQSPFTLARVDKVEPWRPVQEEKVFP